MNSGKLQFLVRFFLGALICASVGAAAGWWMWQSNAKLVQKMAVGSAPADFLTVGQPLAASSVAKKLLDDENATRMWFGYTLLPNVALSAPRTSTNWRIAGTTQVGGVDGLLVLVEGINAPNTVLVGQNLPGGAQLVSVETDQAVIRFEGRVVKLALFK